MTEPTAEWRGRVVGLGTAHGDDRAAWEVVARLRNVLPARVKAEVAADPICMLDVPLGCEILVVIDACRGAGAPGSVYRFAWPDARLAREGGVSSHGVGLAAALELAGALDRLPPCVVIFAVEGVSGAPGAGLSPQVEAALPEVVARVLAEVAVEDAMSQSATPELLRSIAFLAHATDEELRLLLPAARVEQHAVGAMLFREGDDLPHVFIVAEGTIALEVSGPNHRPRRFQTVGPGELLGWSPLLGSGPMTATARALTDVRVVALDAKAVLDLCDRDPRFGFQFMRRTAAAIAARLSATRLQLLDVYRNELPATTEGGGL